MSDRCSGTPVSWLALERRALGELDAAGARLIDAHLARCAACRGCYQSIEACAVVLAPLPPSSAPKRRLGLSWSLAPAIAFAALLLVWLVGDDAVLAPEVGSGADRSKGGELAIELVREARGALLAPTHFAVGDRFKVLVSCSPATDTVRVEVVIHQDGGVSRPLAPARIRCGNGVALPGAFRLAGGPAKVCVHAGDDPSAEAATCVALEPAP